MAKKKGAQNSSIGHFVSRLWMLNHCLHKRENLFLARKKFDACVRGHNRNRLRRESVFVLLEEE
jgi:hypothetical protein